MTYSPTNHGAGVDAAAELNFDGICARIEREALRRAEEAHDPSQQLKWIGIAKSVRERCKTVVEEANARFEAQNTKAEMRHERSRFMATTFTPVLSVLLTAFALAFQARQFKQASENQKNQFTQTSTLQANQSKDEKWRESMKSVSLSDPKASFVGALSMQAFFDSPRYRDESMSIASALLPNVNNVKRF